MILGDLLDSRVLDHDGGALGYVVDVRLALVLGAQDQAAETSETTPLAESRRRDAVECVEVVGLLVSPRTQTSFLGYERSEVRSPWLIAAIVRRLHRGTFLVAWQDVLGIEDGAVRLAEGFQRRDPRVEEDE